jgi:hypothetical protein
MGRRGLILLLVCAALSIAALASGGPTAAIRRQALGEVNCFLATSDGQPAIYSVTDNGNLDLVLTVRVVSETAWSMLFTLFRDGVQVPAIWNGTHALFHAAVFQPGEEYRIAVRLEGLPQGTHCMHLCSADYPYPEGLVTQEQILGNAACFDAFAFTIESTSGIADNQEQAAEAALPVVQGSGELYRAVGQSGALCTSSRLLLISPSFDIRDRQRLFYFWQNPLSREARVRLALLVDWHQVEWPGYGRRNLWGRIPEDGTLITPIDLTSLDLQKVSQIVVVAFTEPTRPFWRRDAAGHVFSDPDSAQVGGSNRVLVLSPKGR